MATVYVVSRGEHSDWRIEAIFSCREQAEAYMREAAPTTADYGDEFNDLQGYELDGRLEFRHGRTYGVEIDLDSGEIRPRGDRDEMRHPTACDVSPVRVVWLPVGAASRVVVKSPVSAEHAAKVAAEKRQEWLWTREVR